ncbi:hypothetical protein ACW4FP_20040 (plasmid) [Paenarthrobacter ureafaciens]
MKVTLSVEGNDGQLSYVEAATYQTAKAAAEAQIPGGSQPIAIRTV